MTRLPKWMTLTCVAGGLLPSLGHADPSPALDRVSIWLGGYAAKFDATADAQNASTGLSLSNQPVLSGRTNVGRIRADVLIMDSQGFSADYFRVNQKRSQGIERSFTAGGVNYDVNGSIAHDTTFEAGNLAYRFWMGEGDAVFGLGLGAQYYAISTDITAKASATGVGAYQAVTRESTSGVAPVLTLGGRMRINDEFRLYADASGSKYQKDGEGGSIVNGALGVEFFPTKNVGIGAEYGVARIRYKRDDGDSVARLNVRMDGPAVYLRLRY